MDFTKTIIPLALMASASKAEWTIASEPIRARGIIVKWSLRDIIALFGMPKCPIVNLYLISYIQCSFWGSDNHKL